MLAIGLSRETIGVDCEAIGRRRNWDGIANCFFTEFEAKAIIAADERMKESTFLRHWVLKEAYIKAIRGSIFGDLNRLVLVNTHSARIEDDGGHGEWHGWLLKEGNCFVALCGLQAEFLLAYRVDQLPLRIDEGISRGSKVFSFEQVRIGR
jgi:phosphopantetheinyl transferase